MIMNDETKDLVTQLNQRIEKVIATIERAGEVMGVSPELETTYREKNQVLVTQLGEMLDQNNDLRRRLTNCEKALKDRNSEIIRLNGIISELKIRVKNRERMEIDLHNAIARDRHVNAENVQFKSIIQKLEKEKFVLEYEVVALKDYLKILISGKPSAKVNCS